MNTQKKTDIILYSSSVREALRKRLKELELSQKDVAEDAKKIIKKE